MDLTEKSRTTAIPHSLAPSLLPEKNQIEHNTLAPQITSYVYLINSFKLHDAAEYHKASPVAPLGPFNFADK